MDGTYAEWKVARERGKAYSWLWSKEQRSENRLAAGVFNDWWN